MPQDNMLGPVLHLLCTTNIPVPVAASILTATFADNTAILASNDNYKETISDVQAAKTSINQWTCEWKLAINEKKLVHVDFAMRPYSYHHIYIDSRLIPHWTYAKYFCIFLDQRLNYQTHVKAERIELNLYLRKLYWILGVILNIASLTNDLYKLCCSKLLSAIASSSGVVQPLTIER